MSEKLYDVVERTDGINTTTWIKWIDAQPALKLQELVKELDLGVLIQSLRDDFNEDGGQVPVEIFRKLSNNLKTMIKIQSQTTLKEERLRGKKDV